VVVIPCAGERLPDPLIEPVTGPPVGLNVICMVEMQLSPAESQIGPVAVMVVPVWNCAWVAETCRGSAQKTMTRANAAKELKKRVRFIFSPIISFIFSRSIFYK
jgi:hypothetical protein